MLLVAGRNNILQVHIGRIAALLHQCQELIKVTGTEGWIYQLLMT
jgi:hypothetical protein